MVGLQIIRLGNPILRSRSKVVTKRQLKTKTFQKFLDELAALCQQYDGVGIAAPQAGVNKRVIVVHVDPQNPRYTGKKPFPLTVVINPKVIERSKEKIEDWEGDLSASIRGLVPRSVSCVVVGLDRAGNVVRFDLSDDFHARVFQHEIDHLDGKFFIDLVRDTRTICEYEEWKKYWKKEEKRVS